MTDRKPDRRGIPERFPYKGENLTFRELSDVTGVTVPALIQYISRQGLTAEEAVERETITHDGKTLVVNEWAQLLDLRPGTLRLRLKKWPKEYALRKEKRPLDEVRDLRWMTPETPDGPVRRSMKEWSTIRGIPMSTISRRLERGWSDTQALGFAPGPKEMAKKRKTENA